LSWNSRAWDRNWEKSFIILAIADFILVSSSRLISDPTGYPTQRDFSNSETTTRQEIWNEWILPGSFGFFPASCLESLLRTGHFVVWMPVSGRGYNPDARSSVGRDENPLGYAMSKGY
jgi:hypothetical protein